MCRDQQGEESKKEILPLVFDAGKPMSPVTVLGGNVASDIRDGAQQRDSGVHQRETPNQIHKGCMCRGLWSWEGVLGGSRSLSTGTKVGKCRVLLRTSISCGRSLTTAGHAIVSSHLSRLSSPVQSPPQLAVDPKT